MTIRKLTGPDGPWYADVRVDGKRHRLSTGTKDSKRAKAIEKKWKAELSSGRRRAAFSGFAAHWMRLASADLKPTTVRSYDRALRLYLVPALGDAEMRTIASEQVQELKADLLQQVSPKTTKNVLGVLSALFRDAVAWGYCERNPCASLRALRAPPPSHAWWTAEESDRFLATVAEHEPAHLALFTLALRAGLRRGELVALRWEDVDLTNRHVHVRRSYSEGVEGTPKSGIARTVPLTQQSVGALQQHPRHVDGLVFGRVSGGHANADWWKKVLDRNIKRAGVRPVRFHDLRHSFASQLVATGCPLPVVQRYLGHSDVQTTMVYSHLAPTELDGWIRRLEAQ